VREEFLGPLGISEHALSAALNVTPSLIHEIVSEQRDVTAETALRLARYFGGDAQSWLNLQQAYDLRTATRAMMQTIIDEITPLATHTGPALEV
jgi:addiction module HigA family antidote